MKFTQEKIVTLCIALIVFGVTLFSVAQIYYTLAHQHYSFMVFYSGNNGKMIGRMGINAPDKVLTDKDFTDIEAYVTKKIGVENILITNVIPIKNGQ